MKRFLLCIVLLMTLSACASLVMIADHPINRSGIEPKIINIQM